MTKPYQCDQCGIGLVVSVEDPALNGPLYCNRCLKGLIPVFIKPETYSRLENMAFGAGESIVDLIELAVVKLCDLVVKEAG